MDHAGGYPASPFSLAFLTDPHLPLPDGLARGLRFKQRLGHASWHRKRHLRHRPEVLAALLDDLSARAPDQIVLGGDLVNIAHPEEFARARTWLEGLGEPADVTLVPGNHDAYVPTTCLDLWHPWTIGDDGEPGFPFRRDRGPVSLIGLSSAVPKPPFLATGTLGEGQVDRAEELLRATADRVRIVVVHHPPDESAPLRKALTDRAALRDVLARTGAELVLHGHLHGANFAKLDGPDRAIPVVGLPSASMIPETEKGDPAGWLLVGIEDRTITLTTRGLTPTGFVTLSRLTLR